MYASQFFQMWLVLNFIYIHTIGRALDDNNLTGTLDINRILAVASATPSLQVVSLTNNKISNVAYSGSINSFSVKFKWVYSSSLDKFG